MSDKIREATLKAIEKKWTEAARLGCVDAFPSALNEAWQSALAQQPAPPAAEQPDTVKTQQVILDAQMRKPADLVTGTSNWAAYMARALLGKEGKA